MLLTATSTFIANSCLRQRLLPTLSFTYSQSRQINLDKLSNKRITRLESDIELEDSQFKSRLYNRNPRNLEQLSFDAKPKGFWLEKSPPSSWNKLVFEQSGRHLYSYLLHWSGKKLIESSTREPRLAKYFKSSSTTQAATVLAQVMARRCLQSGYLYVGVDDRTQNDQLNIKTKVFFETIESNGLALQEPQEIVPRSAIDL